MPLITDDEKLVLLRALKTAFDKELDSQIGEVCVRIHERWKTMPTDTLVQARRAERQRLTDLGLDERFIRESLANDVNCRLSVRDPRPPQPKNVPKTKVWYNAATDTEWSYRDVGDHHYFEYRWTIGITNASNNNAIRKYQRRRILGA